MRLVAEEMLADAYSGINAFGVHAEQFGDTVNQWMDEHFIGKKSEAEMEQLRGPPEGQRFSVDDSSFENAEEAEKAKSIIQQLNDNLGRIMQMDTVAEVDATNAIPFTGNHDNDTAVAAELFNKQGRVASRAGFGNVMLTTKGAGESISHGNGAAKQYAFVAVKNVIESGIEIFSDPNHKGKKYDTVTFAAPIDFFGKKIGMAVVVKKYHQGNDINFYIHEICDSEGNFVKFNDGKKMTAQTTSDPNPTAGAVRGSIIPNDSIDQTGRKVNGQFSVDDTEYLRLAENPAQNYDRLNEMVRQAAEDAGYTDEVNHGTKAFGFTVIDTNASDDKRSFFASKHRDTAQTYSGETSRDSIGQARHVNYAGLYDLNENQYLDEVRKLFPDVKYATDDDLAPRIENINRAFDTDMEMLYLSSYVFDSPEETAQVQKLVDAVRGMKTATNSEQLEAAISDFHAALDDTRKQFGDELYSDLLDAVKMTREAYQAKEEVFDYDWLSIGENAKMPILISRNKMTEMLVAEGNKGIYRLYANTSGMLAISGHGASWHAIRSNIEGLPEHSSTREIAKWAFDHGYRGVIYDDIYDAGSAKYKDVGTDTVYAFFDPQTQLKSADIVTYDDDGKIIPLSERFNAANDDIRFSVDDYDYQDFSWAVNDEILSPLELRKVESAVAETVAQGYNSHSFNDALSITTIDGTKAALFRGSMEQPVIDYVIQCDTGIDQDEIAALKEYFEDAQHENAVRIAEDYFSDEGIRIFSREDSVNNERQNERGTRDDSNASYRGYQGRENQVNNANRRYGPSQAEVDESLERMRTTIREEEEAQKFSIDDGQQERGINFSQVLQDALRSQLA